MDQNLSLQARGAFKLAREAAQHFQQDDIDTEHLLLGLLCTPQSAAGSVLRHMRIDVERVLQEVEAMAQKGATAGEGSLTSRVKEAITPAGEIANSLDHEWIGTEHLLLGLLSLDEGLAITSSALRREHLSLLCLLALGTLFVLGSILLHAVAHISVWPVMVSSLKAAVPDAMYGGGFMSGG